MLANLKQQFEKINSPAWLASLRAENFAQFLAQGLPNKKLEHWKNTDISFLDNQTFAAPEKVTLADKLIKRYLIADCYHVVMVNGFLMAEFSSLPENIQVMDLRQALNEQAELMQNHIEASAQHFVQLNSAFMQHGLFINIPKNAIIAKPLQILFYATDAQQAWMQHLRNLISVAENAQVALIEDYVGAADAQYLNNVVTQISAAKNSNITYYKNQNESGASYHIANTIINQAADSRIKTYSFSFGGKLTRDDLTVNLNEAGASCALYGLYHSNEQSHIDHHTYIEHKAPNCSSYELYKGVLPDKATAVFNGKIKVAPAAQRTYSQLSNKNLLLSKTAQINTKPALEIYADDVKCTHGATVGQIDEVALFYLRSRGIAKADAIHVLTRAFAAEVVAAIEEPKMQRFFEAHF